MGGSSHVFERHYPRRLRVRPKKPGETGRNVARLDKLTTPSVRVSHSTFGAVMPFAIAIVSPPAGAYAWLVVAIGGLSYPIYAPRFVIAFARATAATPAPLGYLHLPPDAAGAL